MNKERILWFAIGAGIVALMHATAKGATTNEVGKVVLIDDAGNTRPAQSIATPGQVETATTTAEATLTEAQALQAAATSAQYIANVALGRTALYSTNFTVTSTVYVQSIGGVPYDPSNQTIRVHTIQIVSTNVEIVATVKQIPLVTPVLDWRQSINGGAWTNITAAVEEMPEWFWEGEDVARVYKFTLPKPSDVSAFFRVVDNSTGASGSGLYWLVFGGIYVDGQKGWTGSITNNTGGVFNVRGGVVVNPTPL
jgi:hypothetical protein